MTDTELKRLTLAGAIGLLGQRKISQEELLSAVLSRIERLNSGSRTFITVMNTGAPNERARATTAVLQGIPLSVKDLFDTKGVRTTAGSRVYAERVPLENAAVVDRLEDAGAVLVGKTNMHEFAYGITTVNPHYGTVPNPWDRERISGGSSGGSASAVALGMGLASLGSDTGGSIRIPASLCGIVGLKPTYGRVSVRGVVPLAWSLDHAGPMTRTVEDAAILLQVIAGHDARDTYSRRIPVPRFTDALTGDIKGLRIGIPSNYFFDNLAPPVESAIQKALQDLGRLGAELVAVEMPRIPIHWAIWMQIASPEAYSYHEVHLQKYPDLYGADVRGRLEAGRQLLSIDYVRAQRARALMKEECKRLFDIVDVIVTPTIPIPAPRIEDLKKPWRTSSTETALAALARFTRYFNVVGLPAISIPCGFTPDGLPLGMQIVGQAFDESTVLRVAHAYERNAGWFEQTPTI